MSDSPYGTTCCVPGCGKPKHIVIPLVDANWMGWPGRAICLDHTNELFEALEKDAERKAKERRP